MRYSHTRPDTCQYSSYLVTYCFPSLSVCPFVHSYDVSKLIPKIRTLSVIFSSLFSSLCCLELLRKTSCFQIKKENCFCFVWISQKAKFEHLKIMSIFTVFSLTLIQNKYLMSIKCPKLNCWLRFVGEMFDLNDRKLSPLILFQVQTNKLGVNNTIPNLFNSRLVYSNPANILRN